MPRGPKYPRTGPEFTALTGLTATSLYLFNEASGSLLDQVGGVDLGVTNTPTFDSSQHGRRGIAYDGAVERHGADGVNLPTGDSLIAGVVCKQLAAGGALVGAVTCLTATADPGWGIYMSTAANDRPTFLVRDAAAGSATNLGADVDWPTAYPGLWLWTLQVDRTNTTARTRISSGGRLLEEFSGSIAGLGDIFGGTQKFAFGAGNAMSYGMWCGYGFYLTGAQCEGSAVLSTLHKSLGWE
jgi:hypothetical protein